MALKHIEAFVRSFSDPQAFAAAAASSASAALAQVTEAARIEEAGHLRCRFSLPPPPQTQPTHTDTLLFVLLCSFCD